MKQFLKCLVVYLICLLCLGAGAAQTGKPNIILILIDDMGWKDLGCTGSSYYQTPHIDRMAAEGIRFTNAYATSPVCSPSRGAILTGRSPARTGFSTVSAGSEATEDTLFEIAKRGEFSSFIRFNQNLEALHYHALPRTETTFGNVFQKAGYRTAYFGKWHCGSHADYRPDRRGFDVAKGYRTQAVGTSAHGHWTAKLKRFAPGLDGFGEDSYVADALTALAVDFIRENKDRPFLLFLSHYAVHAPNQGKPDVVAKYKKRKTDDQRHPEFAAMVESVDDSVGEILRAVKESGIDENTLIVFTSDNGGQIATSTYPLLGAKSFSYEAGLRVPLIARWPGKIAPGRTTHANAIGTDLFPTFMEAADLPLQPGLHCDGVSLTGVLTGKETGAGRSIWFHFPHYTSRTSPFSSIIDGDGWKLIRFYNDDLSGRFQLFNLREDPCEQNDLAARYPNKALQLDKALDVQLKAAGARLPRPNPDYDPKSPRISDKKTTYRNAQNKWTREKELRNAAGGN